MDWDDFLFHEHYVWHSARPRCRQGTVEVRPICQQPFEEHMVASALTVGIAMAPHDVVAAVAASASAAGVEKAEVLKGWVDGDWAGTLAAAWPHLLDLHHRAVAEGLADLAVHALSSGVVAAAHRGLERRGLGEEVFLAPLFRRLEARQNPAQAARALLEAKGIQAVVAAAALR